MVFDNALLFNAVAERLESMKRPVSPDYAQHFWRHLSELLCFQLTSQGSKDPSKYPNNDPGQRGNSNSSIRRGSSADPSRSLKYHGSRIVIPHFAAFVKVAADSYSCLPTVVFVANDAFCDTYNCRSSLNKWRVSGAVRTHELNMRELARRVDRTVDEATRILQGFVGVIGDECEGSSSGSSSSSVRIQLPTVGELCCERRNVSFTFRLAPDPEFAMLLTSVARERPPLPARRGSKNVEDQQQHVSDANNKSKAAEQPSVAAAVESSIQAALEGNQAPELQRMNMQRPASSSSTRCSASGASGVLPYRRPASSAGGSRNNSVAENDHLHQPLDVLALQQQRAASATGYSPANQHSLNSLSGGGRFAVAKSRRHRVQDELATLQDQALSRLSQSPARFGGDQARPASRGSSAYGGGGSSCDERASAASRTVSALSGTLMGVGGSIHRSAFRQPSPVALEAAMQQHADRLNAIANIADSKHKERVRGYNRSVQKQLTNQVQEKQARPNTPATISKSRDASSFENETLNRWRPEENPHRAKITKAMSYKAGLDTQLALKNSREEQEKTLELAVDRENAHLMTGLAIEKFREEQHQKRLAQNASQMAWGSQLELKYLQK